MLSAGSVHFIFPESAFASFNIWNNLTSSYITEESLRVFKLLLLLLLKEMIWTKGVIGAQGNITLLNLCYLTYVLILFYH